MREASWKDFWFNLDDAKHRYNTPEWLNFYARELGLYFPAKPKRVLELGCGNGSLYEFFDGFFDFYIGVDFSSGMLEKFKSSWQDVNLVQADASKLPFRTDGYDLIFSNGVCQYLDTNMLTNNLRQVYKLLDLDGVYLIANIPDANLRSIYYTNALRGDKDRVSFIYPIRRRISTLVRGTTDEIGYWYSRRSICKLAKSQGFMCQTFSSASYEYRFHAFLKKS